MILVSLVQGCFHYAIRAKEAQPTFVPKESVDTSMASAAPLFLLTFRRSNVACICSMIFVSLVHNCFHYAIRAQEAKPTFVPKESVDTSLASGAPHTILTF